MAPHSAWELLEHLRIAQADILEYTRDQSHPSPEFPAGFWPAASEPPDDAAWDRSIDAYHRDVQALREMVLDESVDLAAKLPRGNATWLDQILLAADHNAYHIGQLMLVRRMLGA